MITTTLFEELINEKFTALFNPGDSLRLDNADITLNLILCAITEKGRAIIIETDVARSPYRRTPGISTRHVPGRITIEETKIKVDGAENNCIAIYCRKNSLQKLFSRLMADIIWHLINEGPSSGDPWIYISTRLSGWRLLFSGTDNKSVEKGLIGEMLVLRHLLESENLPVTIWTGPLRGTKDFSLPHETIEVKTTSVRYGYCVEIAGVFQTSSQEGPERLVFIRLEETPNGNLSVQALKADLLKLCSRTGQQPMLESLLEEFPSDLYNSPYRWNLLESIIFNIDDNFPKITNDDFVGHSMPSGIIQITWTADLSSLERNPYPL